jgi:hypothetical protein
MKKIVALDRWLAAVVIAHLTITIGHGAAHNAAHVMLGWASMAFVIVIIEIAPLVGLWLSTRRPREGAALVAASMAASLVFGLVNHFVIVSPDHVSEVADAARPLFAATAVLLVLSEAAGVMLAVRRLMHPLENVA